MDASDIRKLILARASELGIQKALDPSRSQFLDMPEGPFVELVLNDGDKLGEFAEIVELISKEAAAQGLEVDVVLRAIWRVSKIEYVGVAPGASGGIRSAERFRCILQSGQLSQEVLVDVTWDALELLKAKLPELPQSLPQRNAFVKEIVSRFLELQLSFGGVSYWDPVRYPRQDLDSAAMSYMMMHELVKTGA